MTLFVRRRSAPSDARTFRLIHEPGLYRVAMASACHKYPRFDEASRPPHCSSMPRHFPGPVLGPVDGLMGKRAYDDPFDRSDGASRREGRAASCQDEMETGGYWWRSIRDDWGILGIGGLRAFRVTKATEPDNWEANVMSVAGGFGKSWYVALCGLNRLPRRLRTAILSMTNS